MQYRIDQKKQITGQQGEQLRAVILLSCGHPPTIHRCLAVPNPQKNPQKMSLTLICHLLQHRHHHPKNQRGHTKKLPKNLPHRLPLPLKPLTIQVTCYH